jgi:hypothetical protein
MVGNGLQNRCQIQNFNLWLVGNTRVDDGQPPSELLLWRNAMPNALGTASIGFALIE